LSSKFWVGGGTNTNWNSSPTTNWAATSGGAGNQTAPATGDSVFFDGNSGTGASVWNTAISLVTLDCTGSKNPITHGSVLITLTAGNLVLPTGVGGSYTASSSAAAFTFTATTGTQQITTNGGKPGSMTFNGAGGTFQLQDNLALLVNSSAIINLTAGTFDGQTFTVNTPAFQSTGASTRALVGSGTWTIGTANVTGVIWQVSSVLTVSSFTSSINAASTTASGRTFAGGNLTYQGTLSIGASTGGVFAISNANTFHTLAVTGPNFISLNGNTTLSVAPAIAGSSGNAIGFGTSSPGTPTTLSVASGTATFSWCAFRDILCSGGATFTATNSFDLGGNTGISISAPAAGGGGGGIIGG
jgi:hypothetical protein